MDRPHRPQRRRRSRPLLALVVAAACACGGSEAQGQGVGTTQDPADGGAPAGSTGGEASTAGVACSYSHDAYNASASVRLSSTARWSCSGATRSLTANGVPDHDTGSFPNAHNPNSLAAQSVSATMPLVPTPKATGTTTHVVGYAFNGVKFDPSTAGTCTVSGGVTTCSLIGNTGTWNIEALGQGSFDFGVDSSNAHVQPGGAYHYHGMPEGLIANLGLGAAMTLVGFALDGYPVYARWGHSVAGDKSSPLKKVTGSYQLKAQPDAGRPSAATYPLGAFSQDYQYVAGSGDLDECNGRTGVTPEFPQGIYHYYITESYPYIQRCLKGTFTSPGGGPPPPP